MNQITKKVLEEVKRRWTIIDEGLDLDPMIKEAIALTQKLVIEEVEKTIDFWHGAIEITDEINYNRHVLGDDVDKLKIMIRGKLKQEAEG